MKELSSIKRTDNCWNQFWIEYVVWDVFMHFCFLSLFLTQPTTENLWITKLAREKKLYPRNTRKTFEPTKCPREKFWTHEIPPIKNFGQTKYRLEKIIGPTKYPQEKKLDLRNTHEKKFRTHEIHDGTRSSKFSRLLKNFDNHNYSY